MPNTVYTFSFSPPARLAWLSAKIYNVPTEIVQVNLAKGEQLDLDFIKINPRHEVPVFDHDGQFITQSRTIAKYFHENFNQDLEGNDHWYPKDPEERAKVRFSKRNEYLIPNQIIFKIGLDNPTYLFCIYFYLPTFKTF